MRMAAVAARLRQNRVECPLGRYKIEPNDAGVGQAFFKLRRNLGKACSSTSTFTRRPTG